MKLEVLVLVNHRQGGRDGKGQVERGRIWAVMGIGRKVH